MRILAIHGQGTSGHIFHSQTAALRAKLGPAYTFDFVDAPWHAAPAPGIRVLYDESHYTWWPRPSVNCIRGSHQWLRDHVAEHGPYDVVMAFSQGCSLLGSFLLYHARETPDEPLPFKAAFFICGGLPLQALDDLDVPLSQRVRDIDAQTVALLKRKAGRLTDIATNLGSFKASMGLWEDTESLLHDATVMPHEDDVFGMDFTTIPEDIRIRIPTVHVYGAKDPRWPASVQLAFFCDEKNRELYDHGGGHDIPRSTEVSLRMAALLTHLGTEI